mmetsp:Transcript_8867/g.25779  ORF Transcript_8867/g.25779 Transcript_8867/m.25779 type:complete len:193 (+) Transcript_8867:47-625(+)
MLRSLVLTALVACAAGFQAPAATRPAVSAFSAVRPASVVAPMPVQTTRSGIVMSDDPTDKESTIAVALTGAFVGVYFLDNVITAAVLGALAAYLTTTDSKAGEIASATGSNVAKVYKKIVSFATEQNVLPKAKEVTDKVVGVLDSVNQNYGITAKIDEKLLLSEKIETASAKLGEVKSTVSSKVNDLSANMK